MSLKLAYMIFFRNLPESMRQYVDHHEVIPSLWPELLESTGRSKDAARVILQYLNIFSERELIEELIDAAHNSTDWKDNFDLVDTLSSLLQQIEPSSERRH